MNQYMLFQREVREQVRAEYPDESVTQITCRLGYLWRNLPLSEVRNLSKLFRADCIFLFWNLNSMQGFVCVKQFFWLNVCHSVEVIICMNVFFKNQ